MKIIKQLAPGNRDGLKSLNFELESLVYSNVKENFPGNWDCDFITRSLLSGMKKLLNGKNMHTPGNVIKTYWNLYQLKDKTDTTLGDIAFIVQVSYHDGQISKGAVFHATAIKDPGKNTFSSLNKNHYRKPLSFAPHSQILLFDYDTITGMAFPSTAESVIGNYPHSWNNWIPFTHAVTVSANLALSLDSKTTALYKVSLPLSYQICYRYLYGLDLDHSAASLETAGGIKTDRGNPKFLALIAVSHGGADPLTTFDFDKKMYVEFE
jgi:hypothetical protein